MAEQQAMKTCRECRGSIPVGATRCMHCGQSQNKTTNPIVVLFFVAVAVGLAFLAMQAIASAV